MTLKIIFINTHQTSRHNNSEYSTYLSLISQFFRWERKTFQTTSGCTFCDDLNSWRKRSKHLCTHACGSMVHLKCSSDFATYIFEVPEERGVSVWRACQQLLLKLHSRVAGCAGGPGNEARTGRANAPLCHIQHIKIHIFTVISDSLTTLTVDQGHQTGMNRYNSIVKWNYHELEIYSNHIVRKLQYVNSKKIKKYAAMSFESSIGHQKQWVCVNVCAQNKCMHLKPIR